MSRVAPQALNGSVTYNFLATTLKKWTLCKIQFFFPKINTCMSRFQDQLDEYEAERNALLSQNSQAKDEVKLWSCTLLKENIHIFMRLLLYRARKWQRRHTMIVDLFGPLALDALFFFFNESREVHWSRLPSSLFWLALTLCQFQPRGRLPYERGGDACHLV